MAQVTLENVSLGFGGPQVLDRVALSVESRERIGLVGRNGAGKSTLLDIIAGERAVDDGVVRRDPDARLAQLPQRFPEDLEGSVGEVVGSGLGELGALLARYHHLAHQVADGGRVGALDNVQRRIEALDGWDADRRITEVVTRLGLDEEAAYAELSGGVQRRVLLARALVTRPDVLVLDEPTNHLDLDTIEWLEALLLGFHGSVVFVTHDRRFLSRLATRIVELDRGELTSWPGDYPNYLRRRDERLAAEAGAHGRFDKRLAEEEAWIRQGIKARRTRNEGRVRRLEAMRAERASRRTLQGSGRLRAQTGAQSGKRVLEAHGIGFAYDGEPVIADFSTEIVRGDRIGLIGPNGAGKTTLIRLLLGELAPDRGRVVTGTNLEVAYFDQHRVRLDPEATVMDNVAGGSEQVTVDGKGRHVISYLQDFLFTPAQARGPVTALSGGERNRLLLARLFAKPCNLLVMDEPTNDLDVETLELLEEMLSGFTGTVLLASHDRAFLDNVVTSTLVMEGAGRVGEYVGGYSDWQRQRAAPVAERKPATRKTEAPVKREQPRRLGYKEQRELAALPGEIEALEAEVASLEARLADPALYREEGTVIAAARGALDEAKARLEQRYDRWSELEAI